MFAIVGQGLPLACVVFRDGSVLHRNLVASVRLRTRLELLKSPLSGLATGLDLSILAVQMLIMTAYAMAAVYFFDDDRACVSRRRVSGKADTDRHAVSRRERHRHGRTAACSQVSR